MNLLDVKHINVDFVGKEIKSIRCSQYDKDSREYIVHFFDSGKERLISPQEKVILKLIKPDANPVLNDCTVNDDGTVIFKLTEQICAIDGIAPFQFMLLDTNEKTIANTMPIKLIIEKGVFDNDTVTSSYEFDTLLSMLLEIEDIKEYLTELNTKVEKNENERIENENDRIEKETQRDNAEKQRHLKENERIENENERIYAENNRKTDFSDIQNSSNDMMVSANKAITNANNSSINADKSAERANVAAQRCEDMISDNSIILRSEKGAPNGVATLDNNGKVPSNQLPSYLDDVIEGVMSSDGKTFTNSDFEIVVPKSGKIYIDINTNITYRWSGTVFSRIGSDLALGETISTAYRGDRGKIAYEHSQSIHARTDATKVEKSSTNGNIKINGTEIVVYSHPTGTNPHGTTKNDIGLENVPNVATNDQIITYTKSTILSDLVNGEKISVAFGKIAKTVTDLISHVKDSVKHITSDERSEWNNASTHASSAHAPSNAQVNVIENIRVNGVTLTPTSKSVDVKVPTKTSQLTNDNGFITSSDIDTSQNHIHSNKTVLDKLTQAMIDKINGIQAGANKTIVDSALSSTSVNPVQNKIINNALAGKASTSHSHSYLPLSGGTLTGSLTAPTFNGSLNGNASTATKLGTSSKGSATQPIYLNAGVPTACTYTLGKSVPSNAEFTDTKYTHPTTAGNKHIPSGGSTGQILKWASNGTAVWGSDDNSIIEVMDDSNPIGRGNNSGFSDKLPANNINYWYIKFKNGIMIIGFTHALSGSYTSHYIGFPVSFVNDKYSVIMNDHGNSPVVSNDGNGVRVYSKTTNSLYIAVGSIHYQTTNYAESGDEIAGIAIGRWK